MFYKKWGFKPQKKDNNHSNIIGSLTNFGWFPLKVMQLPPSDVAQHRVGRFKRQLMAMILIAMV